MPCSRASFVLSLSLSLGKVHQSSHSFPKTEIGVLQAVCDLLGVSIAGACASKHGVWLVLFLFLVVRGGRLGPRGKPSGSLRAAGREVRSLVGRIEGRTASRRAVTSRQSGSVPGPINTVRHRVGWASFRSGKVGRSPCPPGVVRHAVRLSVHRVSDGRRVGLLSAQACVEALPVGLTVNRVPTLRLFGLLLDAKSVRLCPARSPAQC